MKKKSILLKIFAVCMALLMFPQSALAAIGRADRGEVSLRHISSWPTAPEISSRSGYLIELNSGEVLFAQNEDEKRYPASITKVMTALVVLEHCSLDEQVTFSHAAVSNLEEGGYNGDYKEGEVLTVEQCLYALMLESVNECGYALAEHVAGSVPEFAAMMNAKAEELGCTNTHFTNPHGLTDSEHTTTAHDMARIFWAALQNETFYRIDSTLTYEIPPTEKNANGFKLTNHHKMMFSSSEYYDEDVKAGKTGYISAARNTLVTYAERNGVQLICVVMKGEGSGVVYSDTRKLLDYGFNNFTLVDTGNAADEIVAQMNTAYPFPLKVEGGGKLFLPNGVEGVNLQYDNKGAFDASGIVGKMDYLVGDDVVLSRNVIVDEQALALIVPAGGSSEVTPGETGESKETGETGETQEGQTQDPAATTAETAETKAPEDKTEKKSGSVLKIILIVLAVLILAVFAYWFVIQQIKKRRARMRKKQKLEQMRRQRMRER